MTMNWRGKPLVSLETINSIGATKTSVYARLDASEYPARIRVTDAELNAVNLHRDVFHPEWNYSINSNEVISQYLRAFEFAHVSRDHLRNAELGTRVGTRFSEQGHPPIVASIMSDTMPVWRSNTRDQVRVTGSVASEAGTSWRRPR